MLIIVILHYRAVHMGYVLKSKVLDLAPGLKVDVICIQYSNYM
jgi:hypothetical protein